MVEKIKFKEFNNKGRKGTYIYVKDKGKKGAYYKYSPEDSIEGIVAYYKDNKKKGSIKEYKETYGSVLSGQRDKTTKLRRKAQKYKKHIGTKFSEVLTKGIGASELKDVHNSTNKQLKIAIENMLIPIVKDPEIRSILATEENLKKLTHRIEINLEIKDSSNQTMDLIKTFNKTPQEVINSVKRYLQKGKEVSESSKSDYYTIIKNVLKWKNNVELEGLINRINAKMIFKKN